MATKALFRAEDLEPIQSLTGKSYELVCGELYEVVTGGRHGMTQTRMARRVDEWNDQAQAGTVATERGFRLRRDPDTVRGPDVSFVRKERETEDSLEGFPDFAPDLAVEIRSPSNTWEELLEKVRDYLDAGCRMVVLAWPRQHFIEVHRPGHEPRRLGLDEVWDGADVLPGFRCKVRDLFPQEVL